MTAKIAAQADVYSFGVTLWELLERKRPYKGMDPYQIQVPTRESQGGVANIRKMTQAYTSCSGTSCWLCANAPVQRVAPAATQSAAADRHACAAQTLSIINPEELRLPPVKIPDSLNAASKTAFTALAGLVTMCTATAANERPSIE